MSHYLEETNISPERYVTPLSRYANSEVIYYTDKRYLTFKTYKRVTTTPSSRDRYKIITPGEEYRPDLVSFDYYGTTELWWKLLEVNQMKDIYEFKKNVNILIPDSILR